MTLGGFTENHHYLQPHKRLLAFRGLVTHVWRHLLILDVLPRCINTASIHILLKGVQNLPGGWAGDPRSRAQLFLCYKLSSSWGRICFRKTNDLTSSRTQSCVSVDYINCVAVAFSPVDAEHVFHTAAASQPFSSECLLSQREGGGGWK